MSFASLGLASRSIGQALRVDSLRNLPWEEVLAHRQPANHSGGALNLRLKAAALREWLSFGS